MSLDAGKVMYEWISSPLNARDKHPFNLGEVVDCISGGC